jgi:hypothetical protein
MIAEFYNISHFHWFFPVLRIRINKQKRKEKPWFLLLCDVFLTSGSICHRHGSANLDPDPDLQQMTKMPWIRNTGFFNRLYSNVVVSVFMRLINDFFRWVWYKPVSVNKYEIYFSYSDHYIANNVTISTIPTFCILYKGTVNVFASFQNNRCPTVCTVKFWNNSENDSAKTIFLPFSRFNLITFF